MIMKCKQCGKERNLPIHVTWFDEEFDEEAEADLCGPECAAAFFSGQVDDEALPVWQEE